MDISIITLIVRKGFDYNNKILVGSTTEFAYYTDNKMFDCFNQKRIFGRFNQKIYFILPKFV